MKWCAAASSTAADLVYFAPLLADDVLVLNRSKWHAEDEDPDKVHDYLKSVPLNQKYAKGGTKWAPSFGTEKYLGAAVIPSTNELVLAPSYSGMVPTLTKLHSSKPEVSYVDASGITGL